MNVKEAKKILPKDEFEAFEAVLMNQISRTPESKLKQRASLSRRLRDKYRDLARRQSADVRTRRTNETDTNLHDRRARIFQEIIDRLEDELGGPRKVTPKRPPRKRVSKETLSAAQRDERARKAMLEAKRK